MAKGEINETSVWPVPKFSFLVNFGSNMGTGQFTEVSGLDTEFDIMEYRAGNNPAFSAKKIPGLKKNSNLTLKRGLLPNETNLLNWFNSIKTNSIQRSNITIQLLDETGASLMTWTLQNAFPVKITAADLKATGNEVAIESLELAYEGITLAK